MALCNIAIANGHISDL